jgi:uroporphyrinogen decarboxylase
MLKDKMTPMERAIAISNGNDIDRIQCNPNLSNGIARVVGLKISEFNHSSKALSDAVIATHKRFGGDGAKIFTDLFIISEAMGAKMKYPEDNTVDLLEPAINSVDQISTLTSVNPLKDGRLPIHIEAMKIVKDTIGYEVPCSAAIVGPFTNACFLIGVQEMTKLMIRNPEAVHKLCKISLESCISFVEESLKQGVGISICEPMASSTVISPIHFRRYCKPYMKELVNFMKSKGVTPSIHICGKTDPIWQDIVDLGFSAFSIDNVASLLKCKETIGNQIKIMGNIDPSTVMYSGTPNEVKVATLKCIKDGYDTPKGYSVMSGCGLPVETPMENIDAMLDITRELGWPIDSEKIDFLIKKYGGI